MRRLKKLLMGVAIFFVVFTIVGFFVLPPILKSILVKKLSETLHRQVTINQIKTNPYTLSITARGLMVKDRESSEPFVSCDEIFLDFQSLSIIRMALIVREIRLTNPYTKISRHQDMSYNFSDLIEKKESKPPEKEKSKQLRFSLNNIKIENGSIDFSDEPTQIRHTVRELNIGIPFLSNYPYYIQRYVQPHFSAKINDTPYTVQGQTKPFAESLESSFDINIKDLDIPYYLAYAPLKMNFKIVSAFLDIQAKISFIETKDKKPSVTVEGNVSLKKIAVDDVLSKPLLRLPLLDIFIAPSEPLSKIIHLSKVSIQSPQLQIQRDEKGGLNVQSLLPEEKERKPAPEKKENPIPLSIDIDEIRIPEGKITFSDVSRNKPFKTILNPIELKVDHFSNGKDKKSAYALSVTSEAKENIKLQGELSVEPLWAEGGLEIKSVPLKKYSPYYQDQILFNLEEGHLDFSTRFKYAKGEKEPEISLSGVSVILNSLRLKKPDEQEDFLKIPLLSIKDTLVDLTQKKLTIGIFSTEMGNLTFNRLKNGDLDLLKLFPSPPPKGQIEEIKEERPTPANAAKAGEPWVVKLGKISVVGYQIKAQDQTPSEPVTAMVNDIQIKANNLSTAEGQKGNVSLALRLNERGMISTEGTVGINPIFANLKMSLKDIDVKPFQPYFTDKVKIAVTDGALATSGNLILGSSDKKELKATYGGEASLNHFASIDKVNAEDVLKMESLAFDNIHFDSAPFSMEIKGIALSDFYAHVLITPDGKLNLQEIFAKEEAAKGEPPKKEPPPPEKKAAESSKEKEPSRNIKIGTITLQGGRIDFSDKSVTPEFSAKLSEIGGRVSGLSSEETSSADLELRTKLNDYAPLEIIGKINPLKQDLYVDLKARFNDMDLSPVTPYSGKYAGYTIQKGKLSFDLKYLIEKRKLEAQNVIFLDQFTFGDKVESPHATKLPVKLAIALLKDRKGEIKLDIPASGSLDDPKFSVWGIILKIILNLIAKAAISPFALLGAVFGGGEELSYLDFDYGVAKIGEAATRKIDTLVKALSDRPALKLDIEGHVDSEKDREALKQLFFQRKLKAEKLKEMVKKGVPPVPVDEVKIEPKEYEKYLRVAYKEEKFPKPRNFLGIAKKLPVPEMENLTLTHIEVKDSDLRSLASQRAMSVKDAILKSGKVEPERVFILEPKSLAPEKKEKLKDSRVDFTLK